MQPYFEKDGVTLYHGDCRDILPQFPRKTFDFVLTDPPYLAGHEGRWDGNRCQIIGDEDPSWVAPAFREVARVLKSDSLCLTFYGWPHAEVFLRAWKRAKFRPVSVIVFVKNNWGLGQFTRGQHEQAYLLAKGRPRKPAIAISDVLEWEQTLPQLHPNQKPLNGFSKLIATYSLPGSLVLDPFCGGGTTLMAARNFGRRAVGIEIDERYCELTALRLSQDFLHFPSAASDAPAEQTSLFANLRCT